MPRCKALRGICRKVDKVWAGFFGCGNRKLRFPVSLVFNGLLSFERAAHPCAGGRLSNQQPLLLQKMRNQPNHRVVPIRYRRHFVAR